MTPQYDLKLHPRRATAIEAFGTDHAKRCLQTERAFLAACIFDQQQAQAVSDRLGGEHFTNPAYWRMYCCLIVAESRGTDLTVADLGKLAKAADLDLTEFDLWDLLDEQWNPLDEQWVTGEMVPGLADMLIELAEQEDRFRNSLRNIREIAGDDADRIIEKQLPKLQFEAVA